MDLTDTLQIDLIKIINPHSKNSKKINMLKAVKFVVICKLIIIIIKMYLHSFVKYYKLFLYTTIPLFSYNFS